MNNSYCNMFVDVCLSSPQTESIHGSRFGLNLLVYFQPAGWRQMLSLVRGFLTSSPFSAPQVRQRRGALARPYNGLVHEKRKQKDNQGSVVGGIQGLYCISSFVFAINLNTTMTTPKIEKLMTWNSPLDLFIYWSRINDFIVGIILIACEMTNSSS